MIEDEELRNLYQISSEERLQQLEAGLRHLTLHPDDETTLKELRREAHGLRGDSRGVGVEAVETLAHCFEKILGRIQRQQVILTQDVSDRLYQGLAAISLLVQEAVTAQPSRVNAAEVLEVLTAGVLELQQSPQDASVDAQFVNNDDGTTASAAIAQFNENTSQLIQPAIEDEVLRDLYRITSLERLQNLETGLRQLTSHPDDETTLDELYKEAHSLTGDSRTAGVEPVEILSHTLEQIFISIQQQQVVFTPDVSDRLYQGLAAINCLVQEAVTGQPSGVDIAEIIDRWMEVVLASQHLPQEDEEGFHSDVIPDNKTHQLITPTSRAERNGNVSQLAPTFIVDEDLRDIYKVTSEERLQKLEAGLLHLEKHPNDEATLAELLREAHSLKGDSRSAALATVETLTHAVEDVLLGVKNQQIVLTPEVSDRLYQGLDAIGLLVKEAVTGEPIEVNTVGVLEKLRATVAVPIHPETLPVSTETVVLQSSDAQEDNEGVYSLSTTDNNTPVEVSEAYRIDTIRVPTRELDALITQAEELTVTKIQIAHATTEIEELARLWEKWKGFYRKQRRRSLALPANPFQEQLEKTISSLTLVAQENSAKLDFLAGELREKIRTLRLLPLSTLFQLFPRVVRDLSRQQEKEIKLIIEGGETTADKRIIEELKDSLMHMIRNAIDHGIETPAERKELGKPPVAKLWLRGHQAANSIIIEIADDGRGLDIDKIKQTAIKRKLYQKEELDSLTPNQIYSLIFEPGFSTRTFITEISGRGIGLDVVRTNIERLKGTIQIESTPGQGCTFRLQIGTSLATINTLLVKVQGIIHALPMDYVNGSLLVAPDEIYSVDGRDNITWNGQTIPVVNIADLLQLPNSPAYASVAKLEQQTNELQPCILIKVGEEQIGVFVDRLLDNQEVAIKPQSQLLKRVRNVTGATILPTGEVCMILNPPDLLKSFQQHISPSVFRKPKASLQRKPLILLVEDSIYVRTQEQRLLEKAGYDVVTAIDGLDGYHQLKNRDFDAVISDVEMPRLDGFSLISKIRQHQEYRDLPIILVTTLNSDEDKKRGADAGADAYVLKGKFNQGLLLETLGRLV